jgi:hypothetical protein
MNFQPPTSPPETVTPVLRFDWRDWLPYFEDEKIPEAQKRVLIETIWSIVIGFVDLGWSIAPTSSVDGQGNIGDRMDTQNCGQSIDLKAALEAAVLRSEQVGNSKEAT